MAAEDAGAITAGPDIADVAAAATPRPRSRRRSLLLAAAALPVLVVAAGAGAYFTGMLDSVMSTGDPETRAAHGESEAGEPSRPANPVLYELPDFIVNLNVASQKSRYFKVKAKLELADEGAKGAVEQALPRIVDAFQVYLRELRPEDLEGSAGPYRVREALLRRVGAFVGPDRVTDVLFVEMFVQ